MQKRDVQLKSSEMSEHKSAVSLCNIDYPSIDTSGRIYSNLLTDSLKFIFSEESYLGKKILDIGCGYGWLSEAAAKKDAITYAVDINWSLCYLTHTRSKRKKLDVMVVCCDAEYLPFKDSAFDIATYNSALHHLPKPANGLNESLRVARELFIINEPAAAPSMGAIILLISKFFKKQNRYVKNPDYNSVMDNEENAIRFNIKSLENYFNKRGFVVYAKGNWCYVPPLLQKTSSPVLTEFWRVTIIVLNKVFPMFGHTFTLRARYRN